MRIGYLQSAAMPGVISRLSWPKADDGVTELDFKLGDIVHSAPIFHTFTHSGTEYAMIYAGANDGMLHAFDADTGIERFAYVPGLVFGNLKELTDPLYDHLFFVDLTPFIQTISESNDLIDNDGENGVDDSTRPSTITRPWSQSGLSETAGLHVSRAMASTSGQRPTTECGSSCLSSLISSLPGRV